VDAAEHAEMVEKQLDAMIQRRARKGDVDPDEREELWKASARGCYELDQERLRNAENGKPQGTELAGESASQCGFHPSS
jgi:hypothetical protein